MKRIRVNLPLVEDWSRNCARLVELCTPHVDALRGGTPVVVVFKIVDNRARDGVYVLDRHLLISNQPFRLYNRKVRGGYIHVSLRLVGLQDML